MFCSASLNLALQNTIRPYILFQICKLKTFIWFRSYDSEIYYTFTDEPIFM